MDVEELYGLPLERFVPERAALARALRLAGDRDEAAVVAALRKPSVAARAVNQLARQRRRELQALFAAGDALSEMQARVLAGRADGRALSKVAEREREAVSGLVDIAGSLLAAEGLSVSPSVLERVGETLHAAALDDAARAPVAEGRLERELRHVGLGMGAGEVAAPSKRKPAAEPRRARAGDEAEARKQLEARERAAAQARAEGYTRATEAEAEARRRAGRAAQAVDTAERKRSRAIVALQQSEEALTAAREQARAAETAHRKAERELRQLA